MQRGNNKWNPWRGGGRGGFQKQKAKPMFTIQMNNQNNPDDNEEELAAAVQSEVRTTDKTFSIDREPGEYIGWKLYFPDKSFKESLEIVQRIKAFESHFQDFLHWYDTKDIEESCMLILNLTNLKEDMELRENWTTFDTDLKHKTTETLACIGLAMHNVIIKSQNLASFQHKKIYVRPIGVENRKRIAKALKTPSELISVTGSVTRIEPARIYEKMTCFRCSLCSTELVVKSDPQSTATVFPSSCHRGCPSRGNFTKLITSPYTIFQCKQTIRITDSMMENERNDITTLNVELIHNLVDTVTVGNVVTVTGIIKYGINKKIKVAGKNDGKGYKTYLKCFSVDGKCNVGPETEVLKENNMQFIQMVKAEPSPFRTLVHSLCPSIFGREEVKAGLVLVLLSGSGLVKKRRSESHILLVGNPGTGKSVLLQACSEVSMKGIYVSGPTSTAAGLTAAVGSNGSVEAGSLVLADDGACCIDEFDKMSSHHHTLLEVMEQQMISISKCGVAINLPAHVSIIAAANPVSSFYDKSKTILENVKISTPLMSRFDFIFALGQLSTKRDDQFLAHVTSKATTSRNSNFFTPTTSPAIKKETGTSWLKKDDSEVIDAIPLPLLQHYIAYARENIHPTMSDEAKIEIKTFFCQLKQLTVGGDVQHVTCRQLEALIRLTLARARADMVLEATREHALDVINLFKFTMIDVYDADDPLDTTINSSLAVKRKAQNVSSLSKPKQMKAFLELLTSEVENQNRNEFTTTEMKAMAKELGISDPLGMIDQLNINNYILQRGGGTYRVV